MRTRAVIAMSVFAGVMLTGACVPPGGPTTTTTSPSGPPAAGCYDSFVDTADLSYTGVPNVEGNLTLHLSSDGTCQDLHSHAYSYTLVLALPGWPNPSTFCAANGMQTPQALDAREATYDFRLNGVTIGPDAYFCVKPL
jgi:hypothetical protein